MSTTIEKKLLTVAGSDCSGGAGIQADLKTFTVLGGYGMSVLTALTAQNTTGVQDVQILSGDFVLRQLESIFNDIGADALKTGMLANSEIIETVGRFFSERNQKNIVVDPVMVAKGGTRLLQGEAISTLKKYLLPIASITTPNLSEASILLGKDLETLMHNKKSIEQACEDLLEFGCEAVLIKGGHSKDADNASDCLFTKSVRHRWFIAPRVATKNTHGTGCTLSAAITAFLARGFSLPEAVEKAKKYIQGAIACAANSVIGKGHGPLPHNYIL